MARALCGALLGCAVVACDDTSSAPPPPRPPVAEFLLAAGDSTYWVRSGPDGLRVRSAPILLTRFDEHFYEVFISDDARDYDEASFASTRVFGRDITKNDSLLLYEEGTVQREASAWRKAHPRAAPLDPSVDDAPENPPTVATDDIEVLDVYGPWLTFGHSIDVDIAGRPNHLHRRRRGVLDVRNGQRLTLHALLGEPEATRVQSLARIAFDNLRDSVRRTTDARGDIARSTLASFVFDTLSFGLTDVARQAAIAFVVPGNGQEGEALSLYLPAIIVAPPTGWTAIAPTLPTWAADSNSLQWTRPNYSVNATLKASSDTLTVVLSAQTASGQRHDWPIATVPAPAYQLIPLDITPLGNSLRAALARAFDQSTTLNGTSSHHVRWQHPDAAPFAWRTARFRATDHIADHGTHHSARRVATRNARVPSSRRASTKLAQPTLP